MSRDEVLAFWKLVGRRLPILAKATSADDPVYDELLGQLHRVDPKLFLEFSVQDGAVDLIVTADGNRAHFQSARDVVASAPSIPGCSVRALKPQLGFPLSIEWNGREFQIKDVGFIPVDRTDSGQIDLRLYVTGISGDEDAAAASALLRAIDHGLGEESFAESIGGVVVMALTPDIKADELIPLTQLDAFIKFRKKHRQHGAG